MARTYRVPVQGTITNAGAACDLVLLKPADDKPIRLKGWIIGQTSEVGDAAEEGLRITVKHMTATVTDGTGGSAVTPAKTDQTDPAAGFTTRALDQTTKASSSGTTTTLEELAWNNRATPWDRHIDEPDRPRAIQTEALLVKLETTVADDISFAGFFLVEEL